MARWQEEIRSAIEDALEDDNAYVVLLLEYVSDRLTTSPAASLKTAKIMIAASRLGATYTDVENLLEELEKQ